MTKKNSDIKNSVKKSTGAEHNKPDTKMAPPLSQLKLHHVGMAVESMDKARQDYAKMGFSCTTPVYDPEQNVMLSLCRGGENIIELGPP
jgi:hypothetical protein